MQLPSNYPGTRKKKKCQKITFKTMKKAVDTAQLKIHDCNKHNSWSTLQIAEYLKVEGLNVPLITEIMVCKDDCEVQDVLPPVWNSEGDISTHIDTIMHLLFLGITQSIGMLLKKVFTTFNMYSFFHSHEDLELGTIRGLQLDWCKCWTFGSTKTPFGPWVSENCLAYARVFKHVYSSLDNVKDKKIRILSKKLVASFVATISRIMQDTVNEDLIVSLDRHIKLLLTFLCKLEVEINLKKGKENRKLKVQTTSNFSGLLNLTSYMRDYGPLRLYWEGGFKGEGLLKYIKPMVKQGSHKITFAEKTMKMYYKDRFLQNILDVDLNDNDDAKISVRYGKFRTYKNIEQIEESLAKKKAISVIILHDNTMHVSFYENKIHTIRELIAHDDDGVFIDSTYTTAISLGMKKIVCRSNLTKETYASMWGLAVPLKTGLNGIQQYYIITNTWKERCLDDDGEPLFDLPIVSDCSYTES